MTQHTSLNHWFVMTPDHLALLRELIIVRYKEEGFGVDLGNPFGGSDLYTDIEKILRWPCYDTNTEADAFEQQQSEASSLFEDLPVALQIVLHTGTMNAGFYYRQASRWQAEMLAIETPPLLKQFAREILVSALTGNAQGKRTWSIWDFCFALYQKYVPVYSPIQYYPKIVPALKQLVDARLLVERSGVSHEYRLPGDFTKNT